MKGPFILLFLLFTVASYAQPGKVYTSLSEAWKDPSKVYVLALDKKGLTSIPREIFYMSHLEELYLEKNSIVKIPKDIGQLKNLKILDLDQNKIDSVPSEIGLLTELLELDLDQNDLVYLPVEIGLLKRLKNLDLHQNKLTSLPKEIGLLDSLTDLKIFNNQLENLPAEIGHLIFLTSLNLDFNRLTEIPTTIGNLQNITLLTATNNKLVSMPAEIQKCTKLKSINLSNNEITYIPSGTGNLPELELLYLNNNHIDSFPDNFGSDNKIYHFRLDHNWLTRIPEDLKLSKLRIFTISHNQLEQFPENVSGLDTLLELNISHNKITGIKPSFGSLKNLTSLNASNNSIALLPEEISSLTKLDHLDIKYNLLEKLPSSLEKLTELTGLELYSNEFKKEIKELKKLVNLSMLNISEGQLKLLPKEIENFIQLETICIYMAEDNCINSVPNGEKNAYDYIDPNLYETIEPEKIDLSKTGWMNYLVKKISTGANYEDDQYKDATAYELFRQLKYVATNEDLVKLLEYDDVAVRIYAFEILDERRYTGIFDFIKKHLNDVKEVVSQNHWNYDVSLGSYYVKAKSLTSKQRFIIDSLILFSAEFYDETKRILTTYDTITSFHDGISLLAEKNTEAVFYLAKYRRKSDIPQLQKLLYNSPYLSGITDIFPDEAFLETMEQLYVDKKYSINQIYSLLDYDTKKASGILDKMIEDELNSRTDKSILEYVMRRIANKGEPRLDSVYFNLWKGLSVYPDTLILERMYQSFPDSTIATMKRLFLKNPSTYENQKVKYCLKFLYEKDQEWAVEHYCKIILDFSKKNGRYNYGKMESNYVDFANSVSDKRFAETFLEIFNSNTESFIHPEKLTEYILKLNDAELNKQLVMTLVDNQLIHSWIADEIKGMLKKNNLLDDIISLQEKRKPSVQGSWKMETWKYGTTEKKAPNWAYLELGAIGNYLTVSCTSKTVGKYHFDSTKISFDTILGNSRNWEDHYVNINNEHYFMGSMLATSAVPAVINICRDSTFDETKTVQFLNETGKIIQGEVKYILTDTTLFLQGNGEIKLKLQYNYLTDWSKPIQPVVPYEPWVSDYVNTEHFLSNPPESIGGIPIARYLARNDIDSLSKLFIQGKYGLKKESYEDNRYLLDSIYTENPKTKAFYFYLLNRIIGLAKTDFYYYSQLRSDLSYHCSHFLLNDPCYFFQMVKSGPYAYNYMEWKKYFDRRLWYSEIETLQKNGTEYRIKTDCGKYLPEFKNIVEWMETYDDPDAPPYDGH